MDFRIRGEIPDYLLLLLGYGEKLITSAVVGYGRNPELTSAVAGYGRNHELTSAIAKIRGKIQTMFCCC
jgi:hypothetical protein